MKLHEEFKKETGREPYYSDGAVSHKYVYWLENKINTLLDNMT